MDKIIMKEYEWSKIARIRILVSGVLFLVLLILCITKDTTFAKIAALLEALLAIFMFVQYFYMLKNKIFIQVANDEIKISPILVNFEFSPKVVEWKDISEIKAFPTQIALRLRNESIIKINLVFLNKVERDNLAPIIQEYIDKNKPTT